MTDEQAHPPETRRLTCIQCGYALRGLDPAGRCPECGTEIAETVTFARRRVARVLRRARPVVRSLHERPRPLSRNGDGWIALVAAGLASLPLTWGMLIVWQR